MNTQIKIVTGVWENTNNRNPLNFQHITNPTESWEDTVFSELRTTIRNIKPSMVRIDDYAVSALDILGCDNWHQVTNLFSSIRAELQLDNNKHFTLLFDSTNKKYHLYIHNF